MRNILIFGIFGAGIFWLLRPKPGYAFYDPFLTNAYTPVIEPDLYSAIDNSVAFEPAAESYHATKDPFNPYRDTFWTTPAHGKQYDDIFGDAEAKYNLPAGILASMAYRESNFNPNATNPSGAVGMMQIIPKWHPNLINPFSPVNAIFYAGKILREWYDRFGSWPLALAAYNWGPGNLNKYGIERAPTETRNYIANITSDIGIA